MLTRDEKQIAMNQVNELLRLTGGQLDEAAQRVTDPLLSDWFRAAAAERLGLADRFDDYLRDSGELPTRPDPDKELFVNMLAGIRDALGGETEAPDLHLHSAQENELDEAIQAAQALADDEQARSLLEDVRAHRERMRAGPPATTSGPASE